MSWILFALLAAISESLKDLCSKQGLRSISPQLAALAACLTPVPIVFILVVMTDSFPVLGPQYAWALVLGGTLNILALFQFMRALQASDLSLSVPFISFTPIFLLFTSPIMAGDTPTWQDMVGIVCIVAGAYTIHMPAGHAGLVGPLAAAIRHPGPRRMLSVALIYSLTSNFDKIGVQHSSPLFWSLSISCVMSLGFVLLLHVLPSPTITTPGRQTWRILVMIGLFQTLGLVLHNMALSLGPVPAVIAVKRSSILFAVVWGFLVMRERHVGTRLAGAIWMVAGILIIGLSQDG